MDKFIRGIGIGVMIIAASSMFAQKPANGTAAKKNVQQVWFSKGCAPDCHQYDNDRVIYLDSPAERAHRRIEMFKHRENFLWEPFNPGCGNGQLVGNFCRIVFEVHVRNASCVLTPPAPEVRAIVKPDPLPADSLRFARAFDEFDFFNGGYTVTCTYPIPQMSGDLPEVVSMHPSK